MKARWKAKYATKEQWGVRGENPMGFLNDVACLPVKTKGPTIRMTAELPTRCPSQP